MALTKLTANVSNVQTLSDKPNQNEGLNPSTLKQKFDKGVEDTKEYINNTLTNEIDTEIDELTTKNDSLQSQINNLNTTVVENETDIEQKVSTNYNSFLSFRSQTNSKLSSVLGAPASIDGVSNATRNIDLVAGAGIRITPNNIDKTIIFEATGTSVPQSHGHTHAIGGTDPITGFAEMATNISTNTTNINNHVNNKEMHVPFRDATQFTQEEYKNHYTYYIAGFGEPSLTKLNDGQTIKAKCKSDSTGAVYLHVDTVGAKPVVKSNGLPVTNWKANGIYTLVYNATTENFIQQGEGGEYGSATADKVIKGYTIGTENGLVTGTAREVIIRAAESATDTGMSANLFWNPVLDTGVTQFMPSWTFSLSTSNTTWISPAFQCRATIFFNQLGMRATRTGTNIYQRYFTVQLLDGITDEIIKQFYVNFLSGETNTLYSSYLNDFILEKRIYKVKAIHPGDANLGTVTSFGLGAVGTQFKVVADTPLFVNV